MADGHTDYTGAVPAYTSVASPVESDGGDGSCGGNVSGGVYSPAESSTGVVSMSDTAHTT